MIEFDHKLPSMYIDGHFNGTYNNEELNLPGVLTTKDSELGMFMHKLYNLVHDERRLLFVDGETVACYPNWIRDHVHMMKAFKHWECKLKDYLSFIIRHQSEKGFYYELVKQLDDNHWQFVNEDCRIVYPEDNVALIRLELEADIEYLVVEGVWHYYRATGDIAWVEEVLPSLEKAMDYLTSHPKRWSNEYGLVIRPFTVDTWDFKCEASKIYDRRINSDEKMSIMHGDNSGAYMAMQLLSMFNEKLGQTKKALSWRTRAETIKKNMFKHLWNGKFFIHQLHINHKGLDDLEKERLSMSNAYDMNRGITTREQSEGIIKEFLERKEKNGYFAEWYSIEPPYKPKFSTYEAGKYVNGAISLFAAGELARAAFENGLEEYGYDILTRVMSLEKRDGNLYFLYHPQTAESQGGGPSGWGSAGLMCAIDEGLAGIVDADCLYKTINFSPRFVVTPYKELRYFTGYEISSVYVDVRFIQKDSGMRYDIYSQAEQINAHILLPKGKDCSRVYVNGKKVDFQLVKVNESSYVDFSVAGEKKISIEIIFDNYYFKV